MVVMCSVHARGGNVGVEFDVSLRAGLPWLDTNWKTAQQFGVVRCVEILVLRACWLVSPKISVVKILKNSETSKLLLGPHPFLNLSWPFMPRIIVQADCTHAS